MEIKLVEKNNKILHLLAKAKEKGISVLLIEGVLKLKVAKGSAVDPVLLNELKTRKAELKTFLESTEVDLGEINKLEGRIEKYERSTTDKIPLSFSQQRLWFLDSLEGSVHYHIPSVAKIKGEIDIDILEESFQEIIRRHEILRSTYQEEDGIGYQVLKPVEDWTLDYRVLPKQIDEQEIDHLIAEQTERPFQLSKDFMMRAGLYKVSDQEHLLILVFHHIATDGWSLSVFLNEFQELYNAKKEVRTPDLKELPIQYADYAFWQKKELQGERLNKKIAYWEKQLKGTAYLEFPLDFKRPPVQSNHGELLNFSFDGSLADELQRFAAKKGLTLFMLMLAGFKVLLHKYSKQNTISIGTTSANRNRQEIESLIGFFVNTLVLKSELDDHHSFDEFAIQVKETVLDAFTHQEVPFEKLVEKFEKGRDPSRTPLFQVMFELHNTPGNSEFRLGKALIESRSFEPNTSKFDLTFNIHELENGLEISVEYCTDLFEKSTINRLVRHYEQLLRNAIRFPEHKLADLEFILPTEKALILGQRETTNRLRFNSGTVNLNNTAPINLHFERIVANLKGSELAVWHGAERWDFETLNSYANQIAWTLKDLGIQKNEFVGVYLERSPRLIGSLLGILKAGAVYIPLDTQNPSERIGQMIKNAQIKVVISENEWVDNLNDLSAEGVLLTDEADDIIKQKLKREKVQWKDVKHLGNASKNNPENLNGLRSMAYMLYTSGSTGLPKAAITRHDGAMNHLLAEYDLLELPDQFRFLQSAGIGSDISVWQILGPLLKGGAVVIIDKYDLLDYKKLFKLLSESSVHIVEFVPSYIRAMLRYANAQEIKPQLNDLAWIMMVGEAVPVDVVNDWRNSFSHTRILNGYGPCEASDDIAQYEITNQLSAKRPRVPIGRPIHNMNIVVLDDQGRLCPIGISGELCVSGVGVGPGYWGMPEKTAAQFIDNPFSELLGDKLYKTGDLAKWREDGNLEFLGRIDRQVKIRGHRVELGEVEAFLRKQEGVKDAHLMTSRVVGDQQLLLAFVVPNLSNAENGEAKSLYENLQQHLQSVSKQHLPQFMCPSYFCIIEKLPLNLSDKVDEKTLIAIYEQQHINSTAQDQITPNKAATTKTEKCLKEIWEMILEREVGGVDQDFFEIGGHSLLAIRVKSAIWKKLEIEIDIINLFQFKTIEHLASHLNTLSTGREMPDLGIQERPEKLPLSYAQERLWIIDKIEGSVHYHIPMFYHFKGALDLKALEYAFKNVVDRHEVIRSIFKEEEGKPYQLILPKGQWEMEHINLEGPQSEESLTNYIDSLIQEPFDLSTDHKLRAWTIEVSTDEHMLVMVMHHIVSDGWSESLIINELAELYTARKSGNEAKLKQLPIQYTDYAIWQRKYLSGTLLENKLAYWEQKLQGIEPLQLPIDKQRPAIQSTAGKVYSFTIENELKIALNKLAKENGVTLFMMLTAIFKVLLYRYTGQNNISIGTPVANRDQEEVESLIGFFINSLVLKTDLAEHPSFEELLQRVKQTTLEAFSNQDVPFEKIVDRVEQQRDLSRSPLFQTMIILQNTQEAKEVELDDVLLSFGEPEVKTSKYDLSLSITEMDDLLDIALIYCEDLFLPSTIERLAIHLRELMIAAVANPSEKIGRLNILSAKEEKQLLEDFGICKVEVPLGLSFVDLFEKSVIEHPNQTALVFEDRQWSYQELDQRSNSLTRKLKKMGVVENDLIILCMVDSLDLMLLGILSVLKAGCAYVPIDAETPKERVKYILEDTKATIVLGNNKSQSIFATYEFIQLLSLEESDQTFYTESDASLKQQLSPDNLLYVIYTSGSTGQPKGVRVSHHNMVDYLTGLLEQDAVLSSQTFGLMSTLAADLGNTVVFASLATSGTLHLFAKDNLKDALFLQDYFEEQAIDCIKIVPSHWNALEVEEQPLLPAKTIIFGGEKLPVEAVGKIRNHKKSLKVINHYGPTETTVGKLLHEVNLAFDYQEIPIGKPFSNTEIYIVDKNGSLCPIGISGELWIGGEGLAKGYLNRAELTSEKFVNNPFDQSNYPILYKTGDLVRWQPDGNILIKGRIDDQLKIRGYRVEPGEVAQLLVKHTAVKEAVVMPHTDHKKGVFLVAYVVPEESYNGVQVRIDLQEHLPAYMIPAQFILMPSIPLTANGKIARNSLPSPSQVQLNREYLAPRDELEKQLEEIWKNLLQIKRIGVLDNFFELGGDSIIAIQVVSRAKSKGIPVSPRDLFKFQTIDELAKAIRKKTLEENVAEQGTLEGTAALIPMQKRFFERAENTRPHHNRAVLLEIDKSVPDSHLTQTVEALIAHHDALRFVYQKNEEQWIQSYGTFDHALEIIELQEEKMDEKGIAAICNRYQQSLDISEGPIIRVVLMKTPKNGKANRLFLVAHRLGMDEISLGIFLDHFEIALHCLAEKKKINLGHKTTSFREWTNALTQLTTSHTIESQLPYWQTVVESQTPTTVDMESTTTTSKSQQTLCTKLNKELTNILLSQTNEIYNTQTDDLLLAALMKTFAKWSGINKKIIWVEGHGRENLFPELDTSNTIGWFSTIHPVLLQLENEYTTSDLIRSVKEQLRGLPLNGIGYGLLRYLHPDQKIKNSIKKIYSDIVFSYLGQTDKIGHKSTFLSAAQESVGASISEDHPLTSKLVINASVVNGELQFLWNYASLEYHEETIVKLSDNLKEHLQELIEHCQSMTEKIPSPADFGLNQQVGFKELEVFLETPEQGGRRKELIQRMYPLSPLQFGMLFHNLYEESAFSYLNQSVYHLPSGIDAKLLERSLDYILGNHSVLRTAFFYEAFDVPVQCVYRDVKVPITVFDLSKLEEVDRQQRIENLLVEDKKQKFDFRKAPLLRLMLIKLNDTSFDLVMTHHHILWDGWSFPILMKELLEAYDYFRQGKIPPSIEEDCYEEYIRYIQTKDQYKEKRFWEQYLEGFSQPTFLPFTRNNKERNMGEGIAKEIILEFDKLSTERIKNYAQANHLTVNTIIQATWLFMLSVYTGKKDVVCGATVSGRSATIKDLEKKIGLYINTLPLRTSVQRDQDLLGWLKELQKEQTLVREYEYSALSDIKKWNGINEDIFDSIVVFENFPFDVTPSGEKTLEINSTHAASISNYLMSILAVLDGSLKFVFKYNSTLLPSYYVEMISKHFEQVINQIIDNDVATIADLNVITEEEKRSLIQSFGSNVVPTPKGKTLVELFEERLDNHINNTAIIWKEKHLTFGELNVLANQMADFLTQKHNVGPEQFVTVKLKKTEWMVVAILGILKAGGAYIPIDLDYPADRVAFIEEDSQSKLLLDEEVIKQFISEKENYSSINPPLRASTNTVAYVIYTSGSTGKAKGVEIEHRSVVNEISCQIKNFDITPEDKILQSSNYVFDASVEQMFMSLLTGATMVLVSKNTLLDQELLEQLIIREQISYIHATPSFLKTLEPKPYKDLKRVLAGGEFCSIDLVESWLPFVDFYNKYGPTETTINASTYYCAKGTDVSHLEKIPIGKPLGNTTIMIVNENLEMVPIGIPGELLVGGEAPARGYLNRKELTEEKFIHLPQFNDQRFYRTGDLGRWLPDGNIEFIGRIDDQIKLRGYRIELGEIVSVLQQFEEVELCTAIVAEDDNGIKHLVAYVSVKELFEKDLISLYLKQKLPEYMIPSTIIEVDHFPLTTNGKIDRKALPKPDFSTSSDSEYFEPIGQIEKTLGTIWAELLSVKKIGRESNFFELGGDSIVTIQVVSRMKRAGYALSPKDVFQHQTLSRIAEVVKEKSLNDSISEQGILQGPSKLLPIQQRFFEQEFEGMSHFNQAILLDINKVFTEDVLQSAIALLLERHDALRFSYTKENGVWQQTYGLPYDCFEPIDLTAVPSNQLSKAITAHCTQWQHSLDIEQGKLIKVGHIKTNISDDHNRLFVAIHHLAVDGVSWRIFVEQLEIILKAFQENEEPRLDKKGTSCRQWVNRLEQYATSRKVEKQYDYWRNILQNRIPLHVEKNAIGSSVSKDIRTVEVFLDETTTKALLKDVHQIYQTKINDLLLSALLKTISNWRGEQTLVIGLEGHGREDIFDNIDLSTTVGWFTNLYPVLLSGGDSPEAQLIKSVKEQLRSIPEQGIAYGALRYLHPSEATRSNLAISCWDVVFNYLGQLDNVISTDTILSGAEEEVGQNVSDFCPLKSKLIINSSVTANQLSIEWRYSKKEYEDSTIEALSMKYIEVLKQLVDHCLTKEGREFTPSDFGLNGEVDLDELDEFLQENNGEEILKF